MRWIIGVVNNRAWQGSLIGEPTLPMHGKIHYISHFGVSVSKKPALPDSEPTELREAGWATTLSVANIRASPSCLSRRPRTPYRQ